jgi:hypothetical protein
MRLSFATATFILMAVSCAAVSDGSDAQRQLRRRLQSLSSAQLCRASDIDQSSTVATNDLLLLLAHFGSTELRADIDGNGGAVAAASLLRSDAVSLPLLPALSLSVSLSSSFSPTFLSPAHPWRYVQVWTCRMCSYYWDSLATPARLHRAGPRLALWLRVALPSPRAPPTASRAANHSRF